MVQNENKHFFINYLNKKGKKNKTEKIYNNLLINLKRKKKEKPDNFFEDTIKTLQPKIDIKNISRYKSIIVPVKKTKQINLSLKWLTESFLKNKINKNEHLLNEFLNTLEFKSSSYEKKMSIYKNSQKFKYNTRR
jgi:ribosomal protein S7